MSALFLSPPSRRWGVSVYFMKVVGLTAEFLQVWSMNPQYLHHSDTELDECTFLGPNFQIRISGGEAQDSAFCQALQEVLVSPNLRSNG